MGPSILMCFYDRIRRVGWRWLTCPSPRSQWSVKPISGPTYLILKFFLPHCSYHCQTVTSQIHSGKIRRKRKTLFSNPVEPRAPDLEKEQELGMVRHWEGQAGTGPSLNQVMPWKCLVRLPWHWAFPALSLGLTSPPQAHSPGTILLSYWVIYQLSCILCFTPVRSRIPGRSIWLSEVR